MTGVDVSIGEVLAAFVLVAVAIALSRWQRLDLEDDLLVAVIRSFVQLTAMGYVIGWIFDEDRLVFVAALLTLMVVVGAFTARGRAAGLPGALGALLVALGVAAAATLALLVALGIFPSEPRYLVPVGGMVIGNSMTAAAVTLNRLGDELRSQRASIEAALALGAPSAVAVRPHVRRSLRSGLIPLIDSTKTSGLIFFQGTMVGMLLAGADPIDAVRLQLILLYMLLGGVAIASLVAVAIVQRHCFTAAHQLRELAGGTD